MLEVKDSKILSDLALRDANSFTNEDPSLHQMQAWLDAEDAKPDPDYSIEAEDARNWATSPATADMLLVLISKAPDSAYLAEEMKLMNLAL
jgi:hypothetical protein